MHDTGATCVDYALTIALAAAVVLLVAAFAQPAVSAGLGAPLTPPQTSPRSEDPTIGYGAPERP